MPEKLKVVLRLMTGDRASVIRDILALVSVLYCSGGKNEWTSIPNLVKLLLPPDELWLQPLWGEYKVALITGAYSKVILKEHLAAQ